MMTESSYRLRPWHTGRGDVVVPITGAVKCHAEEESTGTHVEFARKDVDGFRTAAGVIVNRGREERAMNPGGLCAMEVGGPLHGLRYIATVHRSYDGIDHPWRCL